MDSEAAERPVGGGLAPEWHLLNILERYGEQTLVGIGAWQAEVDAPHTLNHPGADLEQFEFDGFDRGRGQFGSGKTLAESPQQSEGEGVHQQSELVGLKSCAAEPIGFEIKLEFFNPVFGITSTGVDRVINLVSRFEKDVGNHKAGVEPLGESLYFCNDST